MAATIVEVQLSEGQIDRIIALLKASLDLTPELIRHAREHGQYPHGSGAEELAEWAAKLINSIEPEVTHGIAPPELKT